MRKTRLTTAAKKSRRRVAVCGHFRTYNCRVTCSEGIFDQAICRDCRKIAKETRVRRDSPLTYGAS